MAGTQYDERIPVARLNEMLFVISKEIERLTNQAFEITALIQEYENEGRAA